MNTRDSVNTIRGDYYQFDYYILNILNQNIEENKIYIEYIKEKTFNEPLISYEKVKLYAIAPV